MGQKKYMKKQVRSEEQSEALHQWKGAMKDMYSGLQVQNDMEEMCLEKAEAIPAEANYGKKKKRGFFSKMNDEVSSKVHTNARFNAKALKKKS